MDIYDAYGTNTELEEQGVWVKILENFEVLIAAWGNPKHKKALKKLQGPYLEQIRRNTLPEAIEQEINIKSIAMGILLNWRGEGMVDEKGKALPYNYKNALKQLSDPRLKNFMGTVFELSMNRATFALKLEEDSEKNLEESSAGKSNGKETKKT